MLTSFQTTSSINYGQSNQLYIPRVKLEAAKKSFYTITAALYLINSQMLPMLNYDSKYIINIILGVSLY